MKEEPRFDRQEILFGSKGQEKLALIRASVVGVGGIGSNVIQQLVYLGLKTFVLVDPDEVQESNLNRLIGATISDVGCHKVQIARRLIMSTNSASEVIPITDSIKSEGAHTAVQNTDFIFGCVDNDGARLTLTKIASEYSIPYLDIASEIHPESRVLGGRIFYSKGGQGCLLCGGLLSQEDIRLSNSNLEELVTESKIYGISVEALRTSGPSVVSLNALLASVGVTEMMIEVTGLGKAQRLITFKRYLYGSWVRGSDDIIFNPDCYYCKSLFGSKLVKSDS